MQPLDARKIRITGNVIDLGVEATPEQVYELRARICHCNASNARDGHIHETKEYVLCLHYENEDGRNCPNRDRA